MFNPFDSKSSSSLLIPKQGVIRHLSHHEWVVFIAKQVWACLFGGLICGLLILTHFFYPSDAWLTRNDFLTLCAVLIQVCLIVFRLETPEEVKVIFIFHVLGTLMEVFKTSMGSWEYLGEGYLRIQNVPLFTGFMYAAIGSYIARSWRLFDFQFDWHPPLWLSTILSVLIYLNFYTHHYMVDIRYFLFGATVLIYGRSMLYLHIMSKPRQVPLLLVFILVAGLIWVAENIGTHTYAWRYAGQQVDQLRVSFSKWGSWFLLMILSYTLVSLVHYPRFKSNLSKNG